MDATPVVFWIAKAMLLRLSSIQEILDRVLSLLSDGRRGSASARGFGTLLASDELVSKTHGAVIRLLSKQRVFGICSSRIATEFRVAKAPAKPNYLVALSGLLKHVPTDIMMMEIDTLIPLLLQSLDLPDQELKAATIESLVGISQESPGAIEGHMSMLVGRLLQAAADPQENMVVRAAHPRCLQISCTDCKCRESATTRYDAYRFSPAGSKKMCCCLSELLLYEVFYQHWMIQRGMLGKQRWIAGQRG